MWASSFYVSFFSLLTFVKLLLTTALASQAEVTREVYIPYTEFAGTLKHAYRRKGFGVDALLLIRTFTLQNGRRKKRKKNNQRRKCHQPAKQSARQKTPLAEKSIEIPRYDSLVYDTHCSGRENSGQLDEKWQVNLMEWIGNVQKAYKKRKRRHSSCVLAFETETIQKDEFRVLLGKARVCKRRLCLGPFRVMHRMFRGRGEMPPPPCGALQERTNAVRGVKKRWKLSSEPTNRRAARIEMRTL